MTLFLKWCATFAVDVVAFHKVKLSSVHWPFFQTTWGKVFWENWDEPACSCCSAVAFVKEVCRAGHACQFLNVVESWTLTSTEASESCRPLSALVWPRGWVVAAHSGQFGILLGSLGAVPCVRHLWNLRNKKLFLSLFQTWWIPSRFFHCISSWISLACLSSFRGLLHLVRQILSYRSDFLIENMCGSNQAWVWREELTSAFQRCDKPELIYGLTLGWEVITVFTQSHAGFASPFDNESFHLKTAFWVDQCDKYAMKSERVERTLIHTGARAVIKAEFTLPSVCTAQPHRALVHCRRKQVAAAVVKNKFRYLLKIIDFDILL